MLAFPCYLPYPWLWYTMSQWHWYEVKTRAPPPTLPDNCAFQEPCTMRIAGLSTWIPNRQTYSLKNQLDVSSGAERWWPLFAERYSIHDIPRYAIQINNTTLNGPVLCVPPEKRAHLLLEHFLQAEERHHISFQVIMQVHCCLGSYGFRLIRDSKLLH